MVRGGPASPDLTGASAAVLPASGDSPASTVAAPSPAAEAALQAPAAGAGEPSQPVASPDDPIHSLSPREREILSLIARGRSNKEIGRELDIAETTVKIHVQRILRKLALGNRVHAAVYASERGF